ncbi:hypothetical protein B0H14DRAFT_2561790 [Mycena olivaceomarginata]|nr:hypothetical protein B0H14DRAFT_2561790 [Mycena olivaceomarginata]
MTFPAINCGITYGEGCHVPTRLNNGEYTVLIQQLIGDTDIMRLALFADAVFSLWAEDIPTLTQRHTLQFRHTPQSPTHSVIIHKADTFVTTFGKHNTVFSKSDTTCLGMSKRNTHASETQILHSDLYYYITSLVHLTMPPVRKPLVTEPAESKAIQRRESLKRYAQKHSKALRASAQLRMTM